LTVFEFLERTLERWRDLPVVLGGDWNATFSNLPLETNPDMRAVPSTVRTRHILQLCENFSLSEPFRLLHPDERDYTYIPSGVLRTNRSRIDYFLISDVIFENVVSCTIAQGFCKKSFDHKHIMLNFKKKKKKGRICINDRVLSNPSLDCAVKLAIYESYLSKVATVPERYSKKAGITQK
jgi:exonuclease III